MSSLWLTLNLPTSDPPHQARPRCPVYILLPSTRPNSCNGHRKVSNALPKSNRSHPHLSSYSSAVPNQACPLLLRLAWSCSLHFSFPTQQCAQPPNSWCAVVKIPLTSEPSLFCPNWWGELVVTASLFADWLLLMWLPPCIPLITTWLACPALTSTAHELYLPHPLCLPINFALPLMSISDQENWSWHNWPPLYHLTFQAHLPMVTLFSCPLH